MAQTVNSPAPPKAQQRELERLAAGMVQAMSDQFRNEALEGLTKSTQNKFTDANYAADYLTMADRVTRKLNKRFNDDRIKELVATVLNKVNRRNRGELYRLVEKRIGISTAQLTANEGMKADIDALILETTEWVKRLRDDTLTEYTASSLRAMSTGATLPDILKQYDGLVEKRKNHAKFTARNQIANFNSITTKLRAQNLGIERAVWLTSEDERVRPAHEDRNGKEFELSEGLFSSKDGLKLLPGVDYQCRCTYDLIIPDNE